MNSLQFPFKKSEIIKSGYTAFLCGRGYAARLDITIPGTDITVDVMGVLPRMRDLKLRLQRGFVPTGILQHMIDGEWYHIEAIIKLSGYEAGYVATLMTEAVENRWVEMEPREGVPYFRILDYRIPARESVIGLIGTANLQDKIAVLEALAGSYSRASFIFPYAVDRKTTEKIVSLGAGIIHYYREFGVFQDVVPAEKHAIEDRVRFALSTEYVLYRNVWIMTEEII